MESWFTPETGLFGLFASAFLSATLLPGSSEVVLIALVKAFPQSLSAAVIVATIGNTLGALTSYGIGRLVPRRVVDAAEHQRAVERMRKYGAPFLLLSWVPLIGDALCVAAGALRLNWLAATAYMAAGKLARYLVVAFAAQQLF
jgi:membrane protein YqaA with SNARE-associated domain